jgi:TonB family protein
MILNYVCSNNLFVNSGTQKYLFVILSLFSVTASAQSSAREKDCARYGLVSGSSEYAKCVGKVDGKVKVPGNIKAPTEALKPSPPVPVEIGKLVVDFQPDADAYYPSFSKRSGEQGEVVVRLTIDETGAVEDAALLRSSSFPRLDRAAADIGRRYHFKPYLVNGKPVKASTNLLIKFNLKD